MALWQLKVIMHIPILGSPTLLNQTPLIPSQFMQWDRWVLKLLFSHMGAIIYQRQIKMYNPQKYPKHLPLIKTISIKDMK